MKLLVTGGAGFIGSNFIRYYLKKHPDCQIVNFDVLTYAGNLENLQGLEDNSHYSFIRGDIRNRRAVKKAMAGIDLVVHFAAETHVDRSILDSSEFITTNIVGTQILLEEARLAGIGRFHHVSTDEVFGSLELGSQTRFFENTPYRPRSPYAASKAGSDHLVRAFYHTYGLPVTISNCSNNYGPYQFPEKLIPLAITNIIERKKVPVYGDGKNIRDWLYVDDHCRAIDLILAKGKEGETYCVGGLTRDISNFEVVKKIVTIMGVSENMVEFVQDRPGHDQRYAINWGKIKNELGWEPEFDFDYYLAQTVRWYREHASWWQGIKTGAYQDYYEKQYGGK
jgi:dTDP-glucose 4,6-dehydratase